MLSKFSYEVIIPAYNARKTIPPLLDQLNKLENPPARICVIDDGSSDNTSMVAMQNNAQVITLPGNKGKGFALKTGIKEFLTKGQADYALFMDADLQHPVSAIPQFLEQVQENTNQLIIIGTRSWNFSNMPFFRILSNTLSSKILSRKIGQNIADSQCGFRMIHREVLEKISLSENGFQLETEFILRACQLGYRLNFVSIPTIYNKSVSNIKHIRDTLTFFKLILREK